MVRYLLVLTLVVFSLSGVSALQTLGTFQINNDVNLIQGCDNSTYSNITRVTYPNSSFAIDAETPMNVTSGGDNYNYTFSDTSVIGQYIVYGHCD